MSEIVDKTNEDINFLKNPHKIVDTETYCKRLNRVVDSKGGKSYGLVGNYFSS